MGIDRKTVGMMALRESMHRRLKAQVKPVRRFGGKGGFGYCGTVDTLGSRTGMRLMGRERSVGYKVMMRTTGVRSEPSSTERLKEQMRPHIFPASP
jgi:hypothetical protein